MRPDLSVNFVSAAGVTVGASVGVGVIGGRVGVGVKRQHVADGCGLNVTATVARQPGLGIAHGGGSE